MIAPYVNQLKDDKEAMVDVLNTKGVEAHYDETFTELVPKIDELKGEGDFFDTNPSYIQYYIKDIPPIDCSKITSLENAFYMNKFGNKFYLKLYNTSNVKNMYRAFALRQYSNVVIDLSEMDTSNVTDMGNMFAVQKIETTYNSPFDIKLKGLGKLKTDKVTSMMSMFYSTSLSNCEPSVQECFDGIQNWNTENLTSIQSAFYWAAIDDTNNDKDVVIDLSNWNTNKLRNVSNMFYYCRVSSNSAKSKVLINLDNFITNAATSLDSMFPGIRGDYNNWELSLNNWDTSNVTSFYNMFGSSSSDYSSAIGVGDKHLTGLNTWSSVEKVTNMGYMFSYLYNLTTLDLSNWVTSALTNISYMFQGCRNLTYLDIRKFNFSKVTNYSQAFSLVPSTCEIIVADDTQKQWLQSRFSSLTNIKTVQEYEG